MTNYDTVNNSTQLIKKNQDELRDQYPEVVDQVKRFDNYYGYSGHLQPATAWLAFTACVVILLVFNGAVLWNGFHFLRFLSSYLAVSEHNPAMWRSH